jgi:hypothetical protein
VTFTSEIAVTPNALQAPGKKLSRLSMKCAAQYRPMSARTAEGKSQTISARLPRTSCAARACTVKQSNGEEVKPRSLKGRQGVAVRRIRSNGGETIYPGERFVITRQRRNGTLDLYKKAARVKEVNRGAFDLLPENTDE